MENFDCVTTTETHSLLVTDVRFRPGSTIFATSSFDRSVRLWDAARVSCHLSHLSWLSLCTFDNFKSSILFRVWIISILPSAWTNNNAIIRFFGCGNYKVCDWFCVVLVVEIYLLLIFCLGFCRT